MQTMRITGRWIIMNTDWSSIDAYLEDNWEVDHYEYRLELD